MACGCGCSDKKSPIDSWICWLLGVSFVAIVFGFQTGYAITNPYIAKSLNLSISHIGVIGAIYTWVFAVTLLISGPLLDKAGARRILPLAAVILTAGILLSSYSQDFQQLALSQILIAIGASCSFIGAGFVGGNDLLLKNMVLCSHGFSLFHHLPLF